MCLRARPSVLFKSLKYKKLDQIARKIFSFTVISLDFPKENRVINYIVC